MSPLSRTLRLLRRLVAQRQGNIALIAAIAIIPIILAIGAAIDISRAYQVRSRLAFALDAAGLAVGSSNGTEAELKIVMKNFFDKNYPATALGTPISLNMTIDGNLIKLTATVQMETSFMKVMGTDKLDISYTNEISKEVKGLEVVMALDNTGSMASSGKIQALRTSAKDLVDILFGNQENPEKLKIGMVPFVTSVNIGPANQGFVNWGAQQWTPHGPVTVTQDSYKFNADGTATNTVWKGCIKERPYPNDVLDASGTWDPYFWPREPRTPVGSTSSNTSCSNRSDATGITPSNNVGYRWNSIDETATDFNYHQSGPNKSCPRAIQPLTNSKSTLLSEIAALVPWGADTGTMIHVGAAWAWRAISPEPPFSEGLPYNTDGWNKAIILLTDGDNTSIRQSSCRINNGGPDHSYTGYGYVSDEGTLGTNAVSGYATRASEAILNENSRLTEVCSNIKGKNILVYTIALGTGIDTTAQALLRGCASDTTKYFASPSADDLRAVFQQIARELSELRVSK
jgi:Flp pilus assembly protein TadG